MKVKNNIYLIITFLIVLFVTSGCVLTVPLDVDSQRDIRRSLPRTKKIPAKIGLYISDDLRRYVFQKQKLGMTFQMNIGNYVVPISKQMISAIFEEVQFVDSLPPYTGAYRPDVEAVVKSEIIYSYGNAIGTVNGYIEAKVKMRVTGYDLSGNIIWFDEALGENRSEELSLVKTFLGNMEKVGQTGYEAALSAAINIIKDFNNSPPKELHSLLEIKGLSTLKARKGISADQLFQKYYQKGQSLYQKKNYHQALYSLEKAEKLRPKDASTLFYIGVCYTYTGRKNRAIEKFERVVKMYPNNQEAKDSAKWLDLLRNPLKIGVVFNNKEELQNVADTIKKSLIQSRFYELIDVNEMKPPVGVMTTKDLDKFLGNAQRKDLFVVLYVSAGKEKGSIRMVQDKGGDVANELTVNIMAKAFSTRKKKLLSEIIIKEKMSVIKLKTWQEEMVLQGILLNRGADKLVLKLLENDIY